MSQKIGVITTGGTIGSILSGRSVSVDPAGDIVRQEIVALCEARGFDVTVTPAFNRNSEDVTPVDWGLVVNTIRTMIEEGITRIVITHGTDTLAYTAAAVGLIFQGQPVRICLTGSFHSLETKDSDGPLNLLAAFEAVAGESLEPGVYVAFRKDDTNQDAHIFAALDLKPMGFDGVAFDSVENRKLATFSRGNGLQAIACTSPPVPSVDGNALDSDALSVAARQILYVAHYPGLSFDRLDHTRLSVLLVGLYHSGTGHSLSGQGSLATFMAHPDHEMPVLAATFPSAHIDVPYESTVKLMDAGVRVVKDLSAHVVYVFAVLELASGTSPKDIVAKLKPWLL